MISINDVLSGSRWDSGTHLGFYCGVKKDHNEYAMNSLDQFLTKEEITQVEILIASAVNSILKSKEV